MAAKLQIKAQTQTQSRYAKTRLIGFQTSLKMLQTRLIGFQTRLIVLQTKEGDFYSKESGSLGVFSLGADADTPLLLRIYLPQRFGSKESGSLGVFPWRGIGESDTPLLLYSLDKIVNLG